MNELEFLLDVENNKDLKRELFESGIKVVRKVRKNDVLSVEDKIIIDRILQSKNSGLKTFIKLYETIRYFPNVIKNYAKNHNEYNQE